MSEDIKPELIKVVTLLGDIKKLMVFDLYKRGDVTSDELAKVLGLKASTIRGMFVKRK